MWKRPFDMPMNTIFRSTPGGREAVCRPISWLRDCPGYALLDKMAILEDHPDGGKIIFAQSGVSVPGSTIS